MQVPSYTHDALFVAASAKENFFVGRPVLECAKVPTRAGRVEHHPVRLRQALMPSRVVSLVQLPLPLC